MTYTEWLEQCLIAVEPYSITCDVLNETEWCHKHCVYASPQIECLKRAFRMQNEKAKRETEETNTRPRTGEIAKKR